MLRIFRNIIKHRTKVLHIDQKESPVICDAEYYVQDAFLSVIETEKTCQKLRSHIGNRCAHRVSLLPIDIKETDWTRTEFRRFYTEFCTSLLDESAHSSGLAYSRKVSFHISHKARHSCLTECFGQDLKGYGLTCTGGTGNESVAVRHFSADRNRACGAVGYIESVFFRKHIILYYFTSSLAFSSAGTI